MQACIFLWEKFELTDERGAQVAFQPKNMLRA